MIGTTRADPELARRTGSSLRISIAYQAVRARILGVVCLLLLCGILTAGLWPFHSPKNEVGWLPHRNGLWFGDYGTILSSSQFSLADWRDASSCSIEIWLVPGLTYDSNTFFAFYNPAHRAGFSLHQSNRDLLLAGNSPDERSSRKAARFYVGYIFRKGQPIFLTVTTDAKATSVYVDGAFVRKSSRIRFSVDIFTGQLVLANSPVANASWSGELGGVALYAQELTAAEVHRHYESWTRTGHPDLTGDERAVALYLFDERSGSVIHNHAGSGANLYIPMRYMELHHTLLERPWNEYYPGWGYAKDILVNIGGFVPLGFFFFAYLSLGLRLRRAALVALLLGAATSLTIEISQAYLPTRSSGMTDLITNTFGTGVGILLYRSMSPMFERLHNHRYRGVRYVATFFANGQDDETCGLRRREDVRCNL